MRKLLLILMLIIPAFSCQTVQKPVITAPPNEEGYAWEKINPPPKNLIAIAKCNVYCSNGTKLSGKAVIKTKNTNATIKLYTATGIFAGKIKITPTEVLSSENIAPFAKYIRDTNQVKASVTGYLKPHSYKILSPYILEIPYGTLRELYYYKHGRFEKVIIEDETCKLTITPEKVKGVKD